MADSLSTSNAKGIFNSFNRYFPGAGGQRAEAINPTGPAGVDDGHYSVTIQFLICSLSLVSSSSGRSEYARPDSDGIPVQIIKDNLPTLCDRLLHIRRTYPSWQPIRIQI